jgi:ABC-type sugar transport system ATPase subunit
MIQEQQNPTEAASVQRQPILEVRNISKRFPGVVALNDVSVQFFPGEVHAVVGENGAGKSTLMKILVGAYVPDSGEILLQGEKVSFAHPVDAQLRGLSIVYQEFNLLPDRTIAQNIYLGREPSRFGVIDFRKLNSMAEKVLKEVGAENMFSASAQLSSLSVAEQQIVEIAKAISFDAKVLIMDEPTAALTVNEVKLLSNLVDRLKSRGMAIIFISHRLKEVFDIAEKITVLKDGCLVGTERTKDVKPAKVVSMMVGRELDHYYPPLAPYTDFGDVVLCVKNASNNIVHNINFDLRAGEIVGVAGLQGSGRTELAEALFGANPFTSGEVELFGKAIKVRNPANAIRLRLGFVTEDRESEGIFANQTVRDNMLLTARTMQSIFKSVLKDGINRSRSIVQTLSKQVDVRISSLDQEIQYLSGGNQQKVVLAKWLASEAKVFLFDEPTRGIDVEAKASIHDLIRELTKKGAAVLMISSELPEIIGMSDRIIVMWDRTIVGELPAKSNETEIMLMATGHAEPIETGQTPQAGQTVVEKE